MSFPTATGNLSETLFGGTEMSKFEQSLEEESTSKYYSKRLNRRDYSYDLYRTVLIVVITAMIFIIIVAFFDVIRNIITSYYISKSIRDPEVDNPPEYIKKTEISDKNAIISSLVFAIIVTVIGLIIIYFLVTYFWRERPSTKE